MYLAMDIGGTNGRVVAYKSLSDTKMIARETFKVTQSNRQDMRLLSHVVDELQSRIGATVEGIGVAVAGKLNKARSELVFSGNLGDWVNKTLKWDMENLFRCPIALGNDAEALALAEAVYGVVATEADFRHRDFLGMIWGTGVGGACVRFASDGSYLTYPGEPGHILIDLHSDMLCGCGELGDVEAICGGGNFLRNYGVAGDKLTDGHRQKITEGMVVCLQNYLCVQPVDLIVFSGGVACKNTAILQQIEHELDHPKFGSPKIVISAFGESAGTLGALSLLSL
jgi:predicted NBD/HSP70 family sugar kinase